MTNLERYKDEIKNIYIRQSGLPPAVVNGKPVLCEEDICDKCHFTDEIHCMEEWFDWMSEGCEDE